MKCETMSTNKERQLIVQEIMEIGEEIKTQQQYKEQFLHNLDRALTEQEKNRMLMGKTKEQQLEYYNNFMLELLDRMDNVNQRLMAEFEEPLVEGTKKDIEYTKKEKKAQLYISKHTRKKYLKDIGASEETLERILHPKKKRKKKKYENVEYTIYRPSIYGKLANFFVEGVTFRLSHSHPKMFDNLYKTLRASDIRIFSKTYVSMTLFTSMMSFLIFLFTGIMVNFFLAMSLPFAIASSTILAIVLAIITATVFLTYPHIVAGSRRRMIKNDLPFVTIHMAAVAGSGAKPISMFKLIATSGEYKGVESEIKKILNYVNLFGYNISTALKTVASSTPSPRFRDLLTGMVATIESGGSLKSYLNSMAEDTMHTYRLERRKYVQTLSTYSDIYTGILIAAPLLFIVTLAIINLIGGDIGGISVANIALGGTYVILPFLNIAFLLFLNIIQPDI
jgi:pilus assembly protein TadC